MRKFLLILVIISPLVTNAKNIESIPVATYSIVAYDKETGQLGVAVQSHWFSVGSLVPWVKAGVGAVATQSFVKVEYGPNALKLLEKGYSANEALDMLLEVDENSAVRQVGIVDCKGNAIAHTGTKCIQYAGHIVGDGYTVQANLMASPKVPPAMVMAYETTKGELVDKLLAALFAAQKEGGDIRGMQSAAILITSGNPTGIEWQDKLFDLRIEDHPDPVSEMKRLVRISRAYNHANQGDIYLEKDMVDSALVEYNLATELYPENAELPFWTAVSLASVGRTKEAFEIFKDVFERAPALKELIPRLVPAGLLPDDEELINKIQKQ